MPRFNLILHGWEKDALVATNCSDEDIPVGTVFTVLWAQRWADDVLKPELELDGTMRDVSLTLMAVEIFRKQVESVSRGYSAGVWLSGTGLDLVNERLTNKVQHVQVLLGGGSGGATIVSHRLCLHCRYDLFGLPVVGNCPECGHEISGVRWKFGFVTDAEGEEFCREIMRRMVEAFGISPEEAVGRINRHWQDHRITRENPMVFHESPGDWAMIIYYGHESQWWKGTTGLRPKRYTS